MINSNFPKLKPPIPMRFAKNLSSLSKPSKQPERRFEQPRKTQDWREKHFVISNQLQHQLSLVFEDCLSRWGQRSSRTGWQKIPAFVEADGVDVVISHIQ